MKILLIEADAAVADATALLLRTQGHAVVRTSDVDSAYVLVEKDGGPDAIVCDAHLHGVDALDGIEKLRERAGRTIPAVLISDTPAELGRRAASRRACRVSPKPAFSGELVSLLQDLIRERNA